ncbi:hypothetical protein BN14_10789 [Rhizoctonia solani AG-1 IB]|uniref:Secreted protein n=1 Tax=Thanatephorus cucumeris (strain AG1-IB / isolate 7/3/14) TaxID=1108050 RepID=M5CGS9_THACB|nr:hypothetical protein BN14_10789 [Rhizoctonia solani AG-1 IB]
MLGLKILTFLMACITLVVASPTPTHKHKDCDRNFFWWSRKGRCFPYGGIRGAIVPPKHHCGRWYWHSSLGPTGMTLSVQLDGAGTTARTLVFLLPPLYLALEELLLDSVDLHISGGDRGHSACLLVDLLFFRSFRMAGSVQATGTGTVMDTVFLAKLGTVQTLYAHLSIAGMKELHAASEAIRIQLLASNRM